MDFRIFPVSKEIFSTQPHAGVSALFGIAQERQVNYCMFGIVSESCRFGALVEPYLCTLGLQWDGPQKFSVHLIIPADSLISLWGRYVPNTLCIFEISWKQHGQIENRQCCQNKYRGNCNTDSNN